MFAVDSDMPVGATVSPSAITPAWIDPLRDERWTTFVARHPRACVFHTRNWLRALQRTYGFEPVALALPGQGGSELNAAIVLCRIESWLTGRRLVSLPFSDHCDPLVDTPLDQRLLVDALRVEQTRARWRYVELRSLAPLSHTGHAFGGSAAYYVHRLDLTKTCDELFRGFHRNHVVRKIRRSERERLTYEEGRSDALLHAFYGLVLKTRRRHRLPPQPLAWFRSVLDCLPTQALLRVASKDRIPIAGILTLRDRDVMMYKYGASDAARHNLGGMQLLLWKTIQAARTDGCVALDLGRSAVENTGEIAFKEHWGAEGQPITYFRCPPPSEGLVGRRANGGLGRRLLSVLPDRLLVAAGSALYPHFG